MRKYNFKFKYKNEDKELFLPIIATLEHKAIEEARYFIEWSKKQNKEIEQGKLIKHIERDEIIWIMEDEFYE